MIAIEELRLQQARLEAKADRRHKEILVDAAKTRSLAKWALGFSIVIPILAALVGAYAVHYWGANDSATNPPPSRANQVAPTP